MSAPVRRASQARKEQEKIRRKHTDPKKRKKLLPGEIPHVEDMAVILTLAGYSRTQVGLTIGISRGQVREILEKPEVTEKLVLLRQKIPAAAQELLENLLIEAVVTIGEVMRRSEDDKYVLQAAAEILDRGGLSKVSRQERKNTNEENINVTDDGLLEKLRGASPEVQEQAAQAIENLEKLLAENATTEKQVVDDSSI